MPTFTARLQLPAPTLTEAADGPAAFTALLEGLDPSDDTAGLVKQGVAVDGQGPRSSRPAAAIRGRYWYSTDTGVVSRDTGTAWVDINPPSVSPLNPTPVKTAAYNLAVQDFVPVDSTGGAVTVTLPNAPADKTRVGVKHIAGANPVTVQTAGTDVLDIAGGLTSQQLTVAGQVFLAQYLASAGIWYVTSAQPPTTAAKVSRLEKAWDPMGPLVVPSGETGVLKGFYVSLAAGESASIVEALYALDVGTATVKLQRTPWGGAAADIPAYSGASALSLSSTPADHAATVTLANHDYIQPVVIAASADAQNMTLTLAIERTF